MTNGPEPTFTTLLDWVEGRIDAPESQHVEDYVAASTDAQATVDWIRDYLRSSSLMPLARPPQVPPSAPEETATRYLRAFGLHSRPTQQAPAAGPR